MDTRKTVKEEMKEAVIYWEDEKEKGVKGMQPWFIS